LEHQSEYEALRAVFAALTQSHCGAHVFANFNVSGRQVDLAVFTDTTTLVVEAKGYTHAVRGGMNGPWEQRGSYGARKIGNAYDQALGIKNALRDEMQKIAQVVGYPNGLVAIIPDVPANSEVTSGDFKVAVGGEREIARMLSQRSGAVFTEAMCDALVVRLHLEPVASVDAALDNRVLLATRASAAYLTAFAEFYGPPAASLLGDQYEHRGSKIELAEVQSMTADGVDGVLVKGPSGCGKTLLATSCAISCMGRYCFPIFVSAKDFDGRLQNLLDREIGLLTSLSARSIISASRVLGKRIILFLDGYNECGDDLKIALTRSLRAFALRFGSGLFITTQHDLSRTELLSLKTIAVKHPSDELKAALARIGEPGEHAGSCISLLQVARSGLEAHLVGLAGTSLSIGASRFAFFDAYSRIKLGVMASDGIRALSILANTLAERACFSLSIREFDRLSDSFDLRRETRDVLLRSQLLHLRGDRVSFVHELFYAAFAAEAVIRGAGKDLSRIRFALKSPRFHSSKSFIVGAIEDDRMVQDVLEGNADQDLLIACYRCECGTFAQTIVKRRIEAILDAMDDEARGVEFELIGEKGDGVAIATASLRRDIADCQSYLPAIVQGLTEGKYFDAVMTACRNMDDAIANAERAFVGDTKPRKTSLRHGLFSEAYVMHHTAAISQLINFIHSGLLGRRQFGVEFELAIRKAWSVAGTPGQFYFLIGLTRFTDHEQELVPYVAQLLKNIRSLPYHLQLDLIDFASRVREAGEPHRTAMIDVLNESLNKLGWMMNTVIIEALSALGALQEEEENYSEVVRREIQNALTTEGPEGDRAAWGVYSCQFDHPFDSAYWEVVQGLDVAQKKLLFTKACRGATKPYISFVGILIRQLADLDDPAVAITIAPWTELPDRKHFMPQDAIEVFVAAHEALGHLGIELPESRGHHSTPADRALLACGELFYWSNRHDVKHPETSIHTQAARSVLLDHSACASAGVLQLTMSKMISIDGTRKSLKDAYPNLVAAVCREAIKRLERQVSFYTHVFRDVTSIATFSIQVLGALGNRDDLVTLRGLCDQESYGVDALDAIKKIEARTSQR
jgi:hypothetical protein